MENFKKGSLVPRRLGWLLASKKKAQHYIVFGCDAIWDGKTLTSAGPMTERECLVVIQHGMSAPRKNGTRQKSGLSFGIEWQMESNRDTQTGEYRVSVYRKPLE